MDSPVSDIELDYEFLQHKAVQNALRGVVADVLHVTAELGAAPGEHHFYIEFVTNADGVIMPADLKSAYPERMTIVLQHQFENLIVDRDLFSVTLWFKGKKADLTIPFAAVSGFADPSVQFELRFEVFEAISGDNDEDGSASDADASADVVSLDAFRKK
ncbi:MAG: ClpXP protease specificity-enhancing factor SspB [Pseudomonadota bacterium]